jgi:hypothetical protein
MTSTGSSKESDATALLRAAVQLKEKTTRRALRIEEILELATSLGVTGAVVSQLVAASHPGALGVPNYLPRPSAARSELTVKDGNLLLEGPRGGWNEVTAFPLTIGIIALLTGLLGLYAAQKQEDLQWALIGCVAIAIALIVGGRGMVSALERQIVTLSRTQAAITRQRGWRSERFEADILNASVSLKVGRAWEVGLPPRGHDLHRQYSVLWLQCGSGRVRLLDGTTEAEKRWVATELSSWIDLARARS